MSLGDFNINIGDPPVCTAGFLPPSSWRSPADTSDIDTPEGLYCKLPQDSPIAVRGARNSPCPGQPGKRAPTAAMCRSDKPFEPLAMHPHALGPYAFDPNLIAQGIPPDDRTNFTRTSTDPLREPRCPRTRAPYLRLRYPAHRRPKCRRPLRLRHRRSSRRPPRARRRSRCCHRRTCRLRHPLESHRPDRHRGPSIRPWRPAHFTHPADRRWLPHGMTPTPDDSSRRTGRCSVNPIW